MCLGVPGRVVEIYEKQGERMGKIDFDGLVKEACLSFVPAVEVNDYAIIHVGFAITQVDEQSALESIRYIKELGELEEELGINQEGEQ